MHTLIQMCEDTVAQPYHFRYLIELKRLWFGVVWVCTCDQSSKEYIKLLPGVSIHGTSQCPDEGEEKQAL